MEIYFDRTPASVIDETAVLAGFVEAGLRPAAETEDDSWIVSFADTSAFVRFQVRDGELSFATLEQSMFEDLTLPQAIFLALEKMGWSADEESVG